MPVSSTGTALGVGPATAADAVPARMKSCPGAEQHAVANVPRRAPEDRPQGATGTGRVLPLELQVIPVLAYHQPYATIGVPGFGVTDETHGP